MVLILIIYKKKKSCLFFFYLTDAALSSHLLTTYSSPQEAVVGSNFTFKWLYKITDADKANFKSVSWQLTPSSTDINLVFVSPFGVPDTSAAPARYKGRITWTGDLSKSVASFVLVNVTPGDEEEYGISMKFGLFDELKDTVDLKVLGKCTSHL